MAISIKTSEDIENALPWPSGSRSVGNDRTVYQTGRHHRRTDRICNDYIVNEQHAILRLPRLPRYPKSVCISIIEVVCHADSG